MFVSEKQKKIIHVILTNYDGKWKSILLSNLVKEISVGQAQAVIDHVHPLLVEVVQKRLDALLEHGAPDCIVEPQRKIVARVERKVHPALAALKKRVKDAA